MCGRALDQTILVQHDAHASVPACDEPDGILRDLPREPIRAEATRGGRLQQDAWLDECDHRRNRRSPASMMRKLHDVGAEVEVARRMHRRQARGGLRLDVAAVEHARPLLRLHREHKRCVVLAA